MRRYMNMLRIRWLLAYMPAWTVTRWRPSNYPTVSCGRSTSYDRFCSGIVKYENRVLDKRKTRDGHQIFSDTPPPSSCLSVPASSCLSLPEIACCAGVAPNSPVWWWVVVVCSVPSSLDVRSWCFSPASSVSCVRPMTSSMVSSENRRSSSMGTVSDFVHD